MNRSTLGQALAAALQGYIGAGGLDHDMLEEFAAEAKVGFIKDALSGGLPDRGGPRDKHHDIHSGLMIADDEARRRERVGLEIFEGEAAKGEEVKHAAAKESDGAAKFFWDVAN